MIKVREVYLMKVMRNDFLTFTLKIFLKIPILICKTKGFYFKIVVLFENNMKYFHFDTIPKLQQQQLAHFFL